MSVWLWSIAVTGGLTAGTCLMNSTVRNQSPSSAPRHLLWGRCHLYHSGQKQPQHLHRQSRMDLSFCYPVFLGPQPVGPRRPRATADTASPETTSVMDRKTAGMAVTNWAVRPLHPVSLTSSPVKMGTVLSSCGAVTVTLIVRTGQMRPIVLSSSLEKYVGPRTSSVSPPTAASQPASTVTRNPTVPTAVMSLAACLPR